MEDGLGDAASSQYGRRRGAQGRQRGGKAALHCQVVLTAPVCLSAQARQSSVASREQIPSMWSRWDQHWEGEPGDRVNMPGILVLRYLVLVSS